MTSDVQKRLQQVIDATEPFSGTVGIAAKDFGSGEEILLNPDAVFPTASTFKTILLYELYRQADAGKIDPAARITVTDDHRVPGSGVIQDLDAGANLTIRDIATLMIIVSDNAGTDMVFDLLGKEAIAGAVRDLGMENTSLPLPTWGLLAGLVDLDPNDRSLSYEELKQKLTDIEPGWDCFALSETPENNITTPRDMLRLHEAIEAGEGLSESGRESVLDILKRQKLSERIPAHLPRGTVVAHKTGSLKGVRNDAGIVYAADGTTYGVAIFVKGAEDNVAGTRLVADLSKVIYERFIGPIATPGSP
jgi:beta-lactamase class A